ncbi:MAG: LysM peptidoglycan-binding domain-containing protein [Eubacterium sp.]|nr:LysM peptidoglycan-binding domain-containing protein [Eubacterium sp.]MDD7208913.1 LysM domain-containing protein [Lachnospiraceae bacterium]MDY5496468.1 LysM domain-containing protein [Anaerobutyricum sp.]
MAEVKQKRNLPKNFRQIGEPGAKKIYMEDYVYTYLNKLAQPGNLYARGAILFGNMYKTPAGNCLFISGAAACQNFELDLEETVFSEENWEEIYRIRDSFFKGQEICGWFLSRMGFSVDLNDKIIRIHMDNFSGENKVLYLVDALENEDAFYQYENYTLKKQRGYYIYYESNPQMKNYMIAEGETNKISEGDGRSDTIKRDAAVVKNYKKALKKKKNIRPRESYRSLTYAAGLVVAAAVVLYGFVAVRNFRQEEQIQTVFKQQDTTTEYVKKGKRSEDTKTTAQKEAETSEEEDSSKSSKATASIKSVESSEAQGTLDAEETWSQPGGYYKVEEGDTLAGISRKLYRSYDYIDAIAEKNNIQNINQIYPGQILELPQIED